MVQQSPQVQVTNEDASMLLGVDGLVVHKVLLEADGARAVLALTKYKTAASGPVCGVPSSSVKCSAVTHPRDVPLRLGPGPARVAQATVTQPRNALPQKEGSSGVNVGHRAG